MYIHSNKGILMKYMVTYNDVLEAKDLEDARRILLRVLESDVNCKDVEHFKFTEYVELKEIKE